MSYIIVGLKNRNLPSSAENLSGNGTNSKAWDAFGDILDEALLNHQEILGSIKNDEWIYQNVYSFIALDDEEFNISMNVINSWISTLLHPTEWQKWGAKVWTDIVVPLMIKDHRYAQ
ncbi:hypothetical protein [Rugamonas rubra]|uniref:hypothetical protein n=1 Tax=Rugamonas rubra TaxID=758825 RepID=UPI001113F2E4|nr:hypothetical protein [Rugamonas rubra]